MWTDVSRALASALYESGFDALGSVEVGSYNSGLEAPFHGYRLPELAGTRSLAVVVSNTRRLWPYFSRACEQADFAERDQPLDEYTRVHVGAATAAVAAHFGIACDVRYACDPPPHGVAIQRLAVLAGATELSPIGLCVQARNGPWLSLRAAAVFEISGPAPQAAPPVCSACRDKPCVAARDRILSEVDEADLMRAATKLDWRDWLAMRDACPIGRDARYGEAQLRYHYTKDRVYLRRQNLQID